MIDFINFDLKKQNLIALIVVILILFLFLPYFSRFINGNTYLIWSESHYHTMLADELMNQKISNPGFNIFGVLPDVQDSVYLSRSMSFSFYHIFLAILGSIIPISDAALFLPMIFGFLSLFIFNKILILFDIEEFNRKIILLFLILSPAFIYTFSFSNPHSAIVFLTLLGFYCFIKDNKYWFATSVLIFAFVSSFTIFNALVILLLLISYVFYTGRKLNSMLVVSLFVGLVTFTAQTPFFLNYSFTHSSDFFIEIVSDMGGLIGFGFFSLLLAIMGVTFHWKNKNSFIMFFISALLILFSSFIVGNSINIYLMFFIAISAGFAFTTLYERTWKLKLVKNISIFILILGLLFSSVSYINRVTDWEPSLDSIYAFEFLKNNASKEDVILSHFENGYFIESIGGGTAFVDSYADSNYNQKFLIKVADTIFSTRDLKTAKTLLSQNNIKYIYIDEKMKSGLVWVKPDEGLLFLLRNKETFNLIYQANGIEIWEFLPSKNKIR